MRTTRTINSFRISKVWCILFNLQEPICLTPTVITKCWSKCKNRMIMCNTWEWTCMIIILWQTLPFSKTNNKPTNTFSYLSNKILWLFTEIPSNGFLIKKLIPNTNPFFIDKKSTSLQLLQFKLNPHLIAILFTVMHTLIFLNKILYMLEILRWWFNNQYK